jgi:hypothetical protein
VSQASELVVYVDIKLFFPRVKLGLGAPHCDGRWSQSLELIAGVESLRSDSFSGVLRYDDSWKLTTSDITKVTSMCSHPCQTPVDHSYDNFSEEVRYLYSNQIHSLDVCFGQHDPGLVET